MSQVDKSIFGRLKRLFSRDVIITAVGNNRLKVVDINKLQAQGKLESNYLYSRYNGIYQSGQFATTNTLNSGMVLKNALYQDYDLMDTDAIVSSALDIYADEATLKNIEGDVLKISSTDEDIKRILHNLFYDVMNVEFNLWGWIRTMCKYGDSYIFLQMAEQFGVTNVLPLSPYHTQRVEDYENRDIKYYYDEQSYGTYQRGQQARKTLENFEVLQFRLLSDMNYLPLGRSVLEGGRKTWKALQMSEEAMLIHRIMRSPQKRSFFVDVGQLPAQDIPAFMQQFISTVKRTPHVDPQTGEYNMKFNLMSLLEDFYIPVRGNNSGMRIETTEGLNFDGITDVNYYKEKLFAALKIPKSYFADEEGVSGKATISAMSIRFGNTIERIQKIVVSELNKVAIAHLTMLGYRGNDVLNFELSLTPPSVIYQQELLDIQQKKVDLAVSMIDNKLFPKDWIYTKVFEISQDEYDDFRDLLIEDAKREFRLSQIENEGNDPSDSGVSYGTPHDLATIYKNNSVDSTELPFDYGDEPEMGRPKEKSSVYGTDDSSWGRDPIGSKEMSNSSNIDMQIKPNMKKGALLELKNLNNLEKQYTGKLVKLFENKKYKKNSLIDD